MFYIVFLTFFVALMLWCLLMPGVWAQYTTAHRSESVRGEI